MVSDLVGVLVCCVSWRGPLPEVHTALQKLTARGAGLYVFSGVTDIALARNLALASVARMVRETQQLDVVLLVDDDVEIEAQSAVELVRYCRDLQAPVSGCYGTNTGVVAATRAKPEDRLHRPWLAGLGLLAVPSEALLSLHDALPLLTHGGKQFKPYCCSGVHPDAPHTWTSEDYWLCRSLGGVHLVPVRADHWKLIPITVPDHVVERVRRLHVGEEEQAE